MSVWHVPGSAHVILMTISGMGTVPGNRYQFLCGVTPDMQGKEPLTEPETEEMAQKLTASNGLTEDPSLSPNSNAKWLPVTSAAVYAMPSLASITPVFMWTYPHPPTHKYT